MIKRKVFCELVESRGRNVWHILPSQYDSTGTTVLEIAVALSKEQIDRAKYTVGCVIGIDSDELRLEKHGKCYTYVGQVSKILETKNACNSDSEFIEYTKYKGLTYKELCEMAEKLTKSILYQIQHDDKIKPLTIDEDGFYITDNDFQLLVRNIKKQVNTLILGPTGSGNLFVY
jgi:hypothetical protein